MYDIYRMRSDGKSTLIIGGYEEFGNAAIATHTLYHIDDVHRSGSPREIPPYAFNIKACAHRETTEQRHSPTLTTDKLTSAYFGLSWKRDQVIHNLSDYGKE